eukprot:365450-Chlamydomonas_euryale.AAC.1
MAGAARWRSHVRKQLGQQLGRWRLSDGWCSGLEIARQKAPRATARALAAGGWRLADGWGSVVADAVQGKGAAGGRASQRRRLTHTMLHTVMSGRDIRSSHVTHVTHVTHVPPHTQTHA